ncbi:hypothetical protein [Pelagibacterium lentulum]|uniref:Uncharacterized protein n=1 Tax=Pelagibacterium lentulum TaxID=2029865 RepID=A0A916VWU1_9HYPH|nr:hypothetical protein [Pelagibacterium lentulum]GGA45851.1 hypothetical protein GCM10011499_14490 [Pelagibacterium lentulum]
MARKPAPYEINLIKAMAMQNGQMTPTPQTLADPKSRRVVRSLKSKGLITEAEGADVPTYQLTGYGWECARGE